MPAICCTVYFVLHLKVLTLKAITLMWAGGNYFVSMSAHIKDLHTTTQNKYNTNAQLIFYHLCFKHGSLRIAKNVIMVSYR